MNKKFLGATVCILVLLLASIPTTADNFKAKDINKDLQELNGESYMQQQLKEAFEYAEKNILSLEGIEGVSYTEEPAKVIVYIESEEYRDIVPDKIKGFPTEIRISGKIYAMGTPLAKEKLKLSGEKTDEDMSSSDTVQLTEEQLNMVYKSLELIKKQNPMYYVIVKRILWKVTTFTDDGTIMVDMDLLKREMQKFETIMPGYQLLPKYDNLGGKRHSRVRPLVGGISCGLPFLLQWMFTYGTLGIVTEKGYLLSCTHVIAMNRFGTHLFPGIPVIQPGNLDGGQWRTEDFAGRLWRYSRIRWIGANYADAAVAYVPWWVSYEAEEVIAEDESSTYEVDMNWAVVPEVGDIVRKSGATSGVTKNDVVDTHATTIVQYAPLKFARFKDVIFVDQPFIEGGDSGSVVFTEAFGYYHWVGVAFAGSYDVGVVCKAKHIWNELGDFT